jgi:hypothetical protein
MAFSLPKDVFAVIFYGDPLIVFFRHTVLLYLY